jgi:hypothetical protein
MTKKQKDIIEKEIILLTKSDVREISGWGKNTVDKLFTRPDFPAIKIGRTYQVEMTAFKKYLSENRNENKRKK